MIYSATYIIC